MARITIDVDLPPEVEITGYQRYQDGPGLTHHFSLGFLGFSWKIQDIHMMLRK